MLRFLWLEDLICRRNVLMTDLNTTVGILAPLLQEYVKKSVLFEESIFMQCWNMPIKLLVCITCFIKDTHMSAYAAVVVAHRYHTTERCKRLAKINKKKNEKEIENKTKILNVY